MSKYKDRTLYIYELQLQCMCVVRTVSINDRAAPLFLKVLPINFVDILFADYIPDTVPNPFSLPLFAPSKA